ncbi:hypothetical protein AALA21_06265 [Eggerthellaceae bacterium 3-80]|nr:hypothetical protein D7W09_05700 [bacterium D16-34]
MRIAFVMDDMSVHSNGTSSTALRYADALREQGHEVICVAFGADGSESFDVPEHHNGRSLYLTNRLQQNTPN